MAGCRRKFTAGVSDVSKSGLLKFYSLKSETPVPAVAFHRISDI
jgi:hypothetical protein